MLVNLLPSDGAILTLPQGGDVCMPAVLNLECSHQRHANIDRVIVFKRPQPLVNEYLMPGKENTGRNPRTRSGTHREELNIPFEHARNDTIGIGHKEHSRHRCSGLAQNSVVTSYFSILLWKDHHYFSQKSNSDLLGKRLFSAHRATP